MAKRALITGINGQDGGYLSELLLAKGYEVFGTGGSNGHRSPKTINFLENDIADRDAVRDLVHDIRPDEIYNFAAQSHVRTSFEQPHLTVNTAGVGALNLFEAVRNVRPKARVFQASSAEMFGNSADEDGFQRETTPMNPVSPYGCAKLLAYNLARVYRVSYGLYISNGILFTHESPRRDTSFVISKICKEAVRIKYGLVGRLELGNTESVRDWGHARDYVRAMWLMVQKDEPDDFVCATGITHSVADVTQHVFKRLELDPDRHVKVDPSLMRSRDDQISCGNSTKLREATGWRPEYTFESMLDEIVDHWLDKLKPELSR
ncbi:MAG TPA: GDP-mannose 4,6-dehydratase [Pyrinomonadaceae bacterium]|nr:GDP-mannose 4,6-dehydratase [Pyrinomonadaceae bacterium]